jgi:3',5'-cyclic-AMP phosphodiesterase
MILVQISDTHIDTSDSLVYGQFDTAACLVRAVELINKMDPLPDLVIHTGDITSHGSVERYERFQSLVVDLLPPLVVIPGNHDERQALRQSLGQTAFLPNQDSDFLHYVVDDFPLRLVCCDSVIDGATPGEMCSTRLAWLADRLAEAPDRPTIVALHHPPFYSGMTGSTAKGLLRGGAELAAVIAEHSQVVRVLSGHVHRPMTTGFGGTIAFAGPTTCYPFGLDTGEERVLNITHEPPAIAVHLWLEDALPTGAGLVSHVLPIGDWADPIPLLKEGKRV